MAYKTITPRVLPVTLPEMRAHLKLDDPNDANELDGLTTARFGAACDFAQHYTGRAIGVQTLEMALPAFPCGPLALPLSPVTSVTSITYTDEAGAVQTCAQGSTYSLNDYGDQHQAVLAYGASWPLARVQWDAVKVRFVCGYSAQTLPDAMRSALLLILGHLHKNNQAAVALKLEEIPLGAVALLDTKKIWGF